MPLSQTRTAWWDAKIKKNIYNDETACADLKNEGWNVIKNPKANSAEIAKINTFYNGSLLAGDRLINFGDIFQFTDNTFMMCITPLCDCLYPNENIKNKYFFVKGQTFDLNEAIGSVMKHFFSYIDEKTCISRAGLGKSSPHDRHTPVYVKPNQLYIPNGTMVNGENHR